MQANLRLRQVTIALSILCLVTSYSCIQPDLTLTLNMLEKNGPYVNKVTYSVIRDDNEILALQDNEIDIIGSPIDIDYIDMLEESDVIEVVTNLRNGYGYFTINCAKYPLNITALRRAIAFAFDKETASSTAWDNRAEPLDALVPKINPFSIERERAVSYYNSNIVVATEILDAAGFLDQDNDGLRESPNRSKLHITIEAASSSSIAVQMCNLLEDALHSLNISTTILLDDTYGSLLSRLYFHGDYDIAFLGRSFNDLDVDWLGNEYASDSADEPYRNYPNFRNESFDSWISQLLYSPDYDSTLEAAQRMQEILLYESPIIVCYENYLTYAYRTDRFENQINDILKGIPGWWTNYLVRLLSEYGGPFGGTLRWSIPLDLDTFNFMVSSSSYVMSVLNMLYDSLLRRGPSGEDILWLAESYVVETHEDNTLIPEEYTRFTFNIKQNVTWTDNVPLTGEDIAFSLNYYRDAEGNPYGFDLSEMTSAYAPTMYEVIIEFETESFWNLHTISYKPIIPKHIFQDIGLDGWNLWNPIPPEEPMVTSGPFTVYDYVAGEFTEIAKNPGYFYVADELIWINIPPNPDYLQFPQYWAGIIALVIMVTTISLFEFKNRRRRK